MDPTDYFHLALGRRAVLPTLVCLLFLVRLWWKGDLYGVQLQVFVVWFAAALTIQLTSQATWGWIAGFLGQVVLAIVLVLKHQWNDFV
jgi:hypothetical protein